MYYMETEVYSWRLSSDLKMELEEAARAESKSLEELLEQIARDWLAQAKEQNGDNEDDEELQRRLHSSAMRFIGTLKGGNPNRAENARSEVRARIARRHGR
jgi:hypothetical protein